METQKWIDYDNFLFDKWFQKVLYLKDKVILPCGTRIDKTPFITNNGFDSEGLNKEIMKYFKKSL